MHYNDDKYIIVAGIVKATSPYTNVCSEEMKRAYIENGQYCITAKSKVYRAAQ